MLRQCAEEMREDGKRVFRQRGKRKGKRGGGGYKKMIE